MHRLILPCVICLTVAACGQTEYIYVSPEVPAEFLEPTPISDRVAHSYRDLAMLATEHLNSAEQANADKACIKKVLTGISDDTCGAEGGGNE